MLLALAVRLGGRWQRQRLHHLAQALIPLAGCGVFLGLTAVTLALLRGEGLYWYWINQLRLALLLAANLWSLWLAHGIVQLWQPRWLRRVPVLLAFTGVLLWVDSAWGWLFWWW